MNTLFSTRRPTPNMEASRPFSTEWNVQTFHEIGLFVTDSLKSLSQQKTERFKWSTTKKSDSKTHQSKSSHEMLTHCCCSFEISTPARENLQPAQPFSLTPSGRMISLETVTSPFSSILIVCIDRTSPFFLFGRLSMVYSIIKLWGRGMSSSPWKMDFTILSWLSNFVTEVVERSPGIGSDAVKRCSI